MGSHSYVHILYCGSFKPSSRFLQGFNPPNTSSAIKTEEIKEHPINLLFYLKVETQVNILKACQQVFVRVHERPSGLNQPKLWVILQKEEMQGTGRSTKFT